MIGWWSHSHDLRVASTRIRGELVMRALRAAGTQACWFTPQESNNFRSLVIAKRHDPETIQLATAFQQRGGKVIVDLCDNRFAYPDDATDLAQQAAQLRQLLALADHVVVSTPTLAEVVRNHVTTLRQLSIIGDLSDEPSIVPTRLRQLLSAKLKARQMLRRLNSLRKSGHILLVWFGSHGGPYADAGMTDLLKIQRLIEQAHDNTPLALTVISNSEEKFHRYIRPFALPTVYAAWHPATFELLLQAHDISVIPINTNPFTICKTDNRVVTSLLHNLAVVADEIPSYLPYRSVIGIDNWNQNLSRYLSDPSSRATDVAAGKSVASRLTDKDRIVAQWQAVFAATKS